MSNNSQPAETPLTPDQVEAYKSLARAILDPSLPIVPRHLRAV